MEDKVEVLKTVTEAEHGHLKGKPLENPYHLCRVQDDSGNWRMFVKNVKPSNNDPDYLKKKKEEKTKKTQAAISKAIEKVTKKRFTKKVEEE